MDHLPSKCKCHTVRIYCRIWDFGIENGTASQVLALSQLISPFFSYSSPFLPNFSVVLFHYALLILPYAITCPFLWFLSTPSSPLLSLERNISPLLVLCPLLLPKYFWLVLCCMSPFSFTFWEIISLPSLASWKPGLVLSSPYIFLLPITCIVELPR